MQLFVDQLTNVDFSYLDAQRGMVGETWWASALLDGILDQQGMICDFGIVKKNLRNWLDDDVDHRLLVPTRSDNLTIQVDEQNRRVELSWRFGQQQLHMKAPLQAVALVDADEITPTTLASWCREQLRAFFPVNVEQLQLDFEPETIVGANYHYSHGLKKHDGNCQRIAHGHRSRIVIHVDGRRDPALEQQWAQRWADIYLGSTEDIIEHQNHTEGGQILFRYQAQQGEFELNMPASCCYLMDTDTTVEFIACHLAAQIKTELGGSKPVSVRAFEGVNKGAIAEA